MRHSLDRRASTERLLLCGIAFACYTSALASLVALGYSLSVLAMSAAGQQAAAVYATFGVVAR